MSSFKCLLTMSIGKILSVGSNVVEFSCLLDPKPYKTCIYWALITYSSRSFSSTREKKRYKISLNQLFNIFSFA